MGNEMEYLSQNCYQQGAVLNRPVKPNVQPQQQYNQGIPLKIKLKQYDLFPGQVAEGNIILQNPGAMLINDIYLHLIYVESWRIQGEKTIAELNEKVLGSICIGIAKVLKINGALINLNPGVYNFPFRFNIPHNIPPCFEFPKGDIKSYIRYTFKASIYSQYTKGEGSVQFFIKARPIIYNSPLVSSSTEHMKKMGMFDQGSTTLKVTLKGATCLIKGKIPFSVEIDNTQGKAKVKSVVAKLVRRVQLRKAQEFKDRYTYEKIIRNTSFNVNVPPNTKSPIFNFDFLTDDATITSFSYSGLSNPYPRLTNIFYVMPSVDSPAVKCYYFLIVTLDFAEMITQKYLPKVSFPIHLNHQEIQDYELEQKETEDLNAAITASLDDMEKNKDTKKENNEEDRKVNKHIEDNDNNIDNEKEINDLNNHLNNIHVNNIDNIMNDNEDIKVNNNIENIKKEIKGILNVMSNGDVEDVENNINNVKEENNLNDEQVENNINIEKEQENNINNEKDEENNINNNKDEEENNNNQPKNFSINDDYEEEYDNNNNNINNEHNENNENNENIENNEENNENENEDKKEENFSVFN